MAISCKHTYTRTRTRNNRMTRARFPAFPPRPRKAFHRADNITSIYCLPLGEFHTCYQLPRRGGRDYGGHRKEPDAHALFSGYDPTTPHSGARDLHSKKRLSTHAFRWYGSGRRRRVIAFVMMFVRGNCRLLTVVVTVSLCCR